MQLGVRHARSRLGRGGGGRYGSRLRDQAGVAPVGLRPPARLDPARPESAASSSDHGTSGLLHPMPGLYSNTRSKEDRSSRVVTGAREGVATGRLGPCALALADCVVAGRPAVGLLA